MGKLSVALSVGATGSVASVGGAYMLGAFGNGDLDIPTSLEKFKENNGGSAVSRYFSGVLMNDSSKEGATWGTGSKPDTNFLGTNTTNGEGRLVVNWEKFKCSPDENEKWTGRIRWLWTFINGTEDKGLVLYASATASSSEPSKLDAKGVVYALSKESNSWTIKYNKLSSATVKIDDLSDSKFPTVGDTFKSVLKVKDYWGFMDSTDSSLTKLCKSESILDGSKKPDKEFKGSWIWKHQDGSSQKPFDWSKTNHSWLATFYGTTPNLNLETLVNSFTTGAWEGERFVNKDLGINATSTQ